VSNRSNRSSNGVMLLYTTLAVHDVETHGTSYIDTRHKTASGLDTWCLQKNMSNRLLHSASLRLADCCLLHAGNSQSSTTTAVTAAAAATRFKQAVCPLSRSHELVGRTLPTERDVASFEIFRNQRFPGCQGTLQGWWG